MAASDGILIVDQDSRTAAEMKGLLETVGYSVTTADGPEQALELLNPHIHRLVLVEQELPDLSGLDLVREMLPLVPHAVFGILAAGQDALSAHEAEALGVAGWLFKPPGPRAILLKVAEWLRLAKKPSHRLKSNGHEEKEGSSASLARPSASL